MNDIERSPVVKLLSEFSPMHLNTAVTMYCCRDGTCHYGKKWIDPAIPVYVFPSATDAMNVQVLMCFTVHAQHPKLPDNEPWYKFNDVMSSGHEQPDGGRVFELEDLYLLTAKIDAVYKKYRHNWQDKGGEKEHA